MKNSAKDSAQIEYSKTKKKHRKSARRNAPISAQKGDILLFHDARQWNRLITWFTKSPYYHVALYEGNYCVIEARPRGVVRRDLNGPDGDKCFDVIAAPENRGDAALDWAVTQIGQSYDKIDILVIVLDRIFGSFRINRTRNNEYSCGEFVATAYEQAGVHLFPDREICEVVPADFAPMLPPKILARRRREEES